MLREKARQWHLGDIVGHRESRVRELAILGPVSVVFLGLRHFHLMADAPAWFSFGALWLGYLAAMLSGTVWPPESSPRQLAYRTAIHLLGVTAAIYATGWGPMVSVGYIAFIADNARQLGSKSVRPSLLWALVGVFLGQVGIALGWLPTLIPTPYVHGLAVLSVAGLICAVQFFATATARNEASEETATVLLALAQDLAEPGTRAEVAERLAAAVPRVVGAQQATVLLWEQASRSMTVQGVHGFSPERTADLRELGTYPVSEADEDALLSDPRPRHILRGHHDARARAVMDAYEADELYVVPIAAWRELQGIIVVGPSREPLLSDRMVGLAHQAATALETSRLLEQERQTVSRLREADRLKSEFLAVVSHELRTPLAVMMGAARTLQWRGADLQANLRDELVDSMVRRGEALNRMVDDLLQSSGEVRLELAPVDLAGLVRSAVTDAVKLHPNSDLLCHVPSELVAVGDATRLRQVVDNLLTNALKYAPDAPIRVSGEQDGRHARVVVSDQGPGMTDEDRARAFDPFWQADSSSRRKVGGIGLGLHISRRIIEAHGGTIWMESPQGQGTEVHVRLPLAGPSS